MATFIDGNNQCASPYSGNDKIVIKRTGVPVGEWVEAGIPTNQIFTTVNGLETTSQHWAGANDTSNGWRQAGADGMVTFEFNASVLDAVVSATISNGWVLPAGTYQVKTKLFSDKTGASIETADIQIVGEATAAITTAAKNRGKKK